jgi:DNA topoisomerase-1
MDYTLMISEKLMPLKRLPKHWLITAHSWKIKWQSKIFLVQARRQKLSCSSAVGHLFTLRDLEKGKWTYPVFENEWVPTFEADKTAYYSKPYYDNFINFSKKASDVIICTDYDNEGSVIAYNILRFILKRKNAKRMLFTTLTKEELVESFEAAKEGSDRGMINAGLARHHLDWMYGVNITRALTLALKSARKILSLNKHGKSPRPDPHILCERENEITAFVPKEYWQIKLNWDNDMKRTIKKKGFLIKKSLTRFIVIAKAKKRNYKRCKKKRIGGNAS